MKEIVCSKCGHVSEKLSEKLTADDYLKIVAITAAASTPMIVPLADYIYFSAEGLIAQYKFGFMALNWTVIPSLVFVLVKFVYSSWNAFCPECRRVFKGESK